MKSESESEAGGGVAARLRIVGLSLFVRFLKAICGISAVTEGSVIVFATPEVRRGRRLRLRPEFVVVEQSPQG